MKKALIGAGGFAREIRAHMNESKIVYFIDDFIYNKFKTPPIDIFPLSKFDPLEYEVLVAVGTPQFRVDIVNRLPKNTKYFTFIHPSAQILDKDIFIGEGSIICADCVLTTNIVIGKHSHLNLQTTIGHDCRIGDFFTTAPGAKISGNCNIGNSVYIGTNSSVKEKINICDEVTVGLMAGVVKDIIESGVYVGTPTKIIKHKDYEDKDSLQSS